MFCNFLSCIADICLSAETETDNGQQPPSKVNEDARDQTQTDPRNIKGEPITATTSQPGLPYDDGESSILTAALLPAGRQTDVYVTPKKPHEGQGNNIPSSYRKLRDTPSSTSTAPLSPFSSPVAERLSDPSTPKSYSPRLFKPDNAENHNQPSAEFLTKYSRPHNPIESTFANVDSGSDSGSDSDISSQGGGPDYY